MPTSFSSRAAQLWVAADVDRCVPVFKLRYHRVAVHAAEPVAVGRHMERLSREQVQRVVERLLDPSLPEEEIDALADHLDEGVIYPGGASLLVQFWENHFGPHEHPPVHEIVDRIMSYRPIELPASSE